MTTKQHDIEHRPLRIENFYSDLIFRPYLCATMDMRESWLRVDNVIRRSNLSRDDFRGDQRFEGAQWAVEYVQHQFLN